MSAPLDLRRTHGVLSAIRHAETLTAGNLHEEARDSASFAALELLALLGLNERQVESARCAIVAAETRGKTDFDLAVERGEVIDELARPLSHERDTRGEKH
jgi:hypothetical protein